MEYVQNVAKTRWKKVIVIARHVACMEGSCIKNGRGWVYVLLVLPVHMSQIQPYAPNVQWIDIAANFAKRDMTHDEFVAFCRTVVYNANKQLSLSEMEEKCHNN